MQFCAWLLVYCVYILLLKIQGPISIKQCHITSVEILIIKMKWTHDYLIFMKEISIPGKMVFILKQGSDDNKTQAINPKWLKKWFDTEQGHQVSLYLPIEI